jgi:hypothetical protein
MTSPILSRSRPWLTPAEAASELAETFHGFFSEADLLRSALDGHLRLSVLVPTGTTAKSLKNHTNTQIEGLWDLPMEGSARRQVEHEFNSLSGLPFISMEGVSGATVARFGDRYELKADRGTSGFAPRGASALSREAIIVVSRHDLNAFIERINIEVERAVQEQQKKERASASSLPPEKPLQTRERRTLLLMIAALAKQAHLDLSTASKSGEALSSALRELGYEIAPNTIAKHLRAVRAELTGEPDTEPPS